MSVSFGSAPQRWTRPSAMSWQDFLASKIADLPSAARSPLWTLRGPDAARNTFETQRGAAFTGPTPA